MAKGDELRIRQVNPQVLQDLQNIAGNMGISTGDLLKPKLREIRDSYPQDLRRPPKKD